MKVFIENEAGSVVKCLHNEKTLELLGQTSVSRAYPLPYGFVLETTADDGDNVDCFVLTGSQLRRGDIVECDPVALMEQVEDGEVDHKILCVLHGESEELDLNTRDALVEFATHVFDHVPGKKMCIGNFLDRQAAVDFFRKHSDRVELFEEKPCNLD